MVDIVIRKSQFWLFRARFVSLAAFVIVITHNASEKPAPLPVKLKCLCSEPCPPVERKKKLTHTPARGLSVLGDTCKSKKPFYFVSLPPAPPPPNYLLSIKDSGIHSPAPTIFWDVNLPFSLPADFPNKVIFLASKSHLLDLLASPAASRVSLDSVTILWNANWFHNVSSPLSVDNFWELVAVVEVSSRTS